MDAVFTACLNRLQMLHAAMDAALEGLPPAALDWSPSEDVNSLAVLAAHVAGSERYWMSDVVARVSTGRDRAAEFQTQGIAAAELRARLAAALEGSAAILARLTLADLETPRVAPRDGETHTVAWVLAHVLEHTALHVGHMQLMRQWWTSAHAAGLGAGRPRG